MFCFAWINWKVLIKQVTLVATITCCKEPDSEYPKHDSTSRWFSGQVRNVSPVQSSKMEGALLHGPVYQRRREMGCNCILSSVKRTLGWLGFFWRAWATALWLLGPLRMMESLVKLGIYEPTAMTLWWDGLHFNKIFSWMAGKTEHHKTCFLVDVFSSRQTSYFTRRSMSSTNFLILFL